jgi:hypothetical protein
MADSQVAALSRLEGRVNGMRGAAVAPVAHRERHDGRSDAASSRAESRFAPEADPARDRFSSPRGERTG